MRPSADCHQIKKCIMGTLTVAAIAVLTACSGPTGPTTEPEPEPVDSAYAALPITLAPDEFVVPPRALIDVSSHEQGRTPYTSLIVNKMPTLKLCTIGRYVYEGLSPMPVLPLCAELEATGHIFLTREQVDLLLTDWSCDPVNREAPAPTIGLGSCFGLNVYSHFWDREKVSIWPEDADTRYRVHGCGDTWVGYRLKRRVEGGNAASYPVDAVFSDTVNIRVTC